MPLTLEQNIHDARHAEPDPPRMSGAAATPFLTIALIFAATFIYYNTATPLTYLAVILYLVSGLVIGIDIRNNPASHEGDFLNLFRTNYFLHGAIGCVSAYLGYLSYQTFYYSGYGFVPRAEWNLPCTTAILIASIAVSEELFFRGYLQVRLSDSMSMASSILLSSLSIAVYKIIIHLNGIDFLKIVEVGGFSFAGSIWLGYLLARYKTVVSPIVFHVAWDFLVYSHHTRTPYWIF